MSWFKRLICNHVYPATVFTIECYHKVKCTLCGKEKTLEYHEWVVDRTCEYYDSNFGPAIKYFYRCKKCNKLETRVSR